MILSAAVSDVMDRSGPCDINVIIRGRTYWLCTHMHVYPICSPTTLQNATEKTPSCRLHKVKQTELTVSTAAKYASVWENIHAEYFGANFSTLLLQRPTKNTT